MDPALCGRVWDCLQTRSSPSRSMESGWKAASETEGRRVAEFRDQKDAGHYGSPGQEESQARGWQECSRLGDIGMEAVRAGGCSSFDLGGDG